MIYVMPLFIVVPGLLLAVWYFVFRATVRHERAVETAKKKNADFEELLRAEGEPLYCLGCETRFPGPIGEYGCPACSTLALVMPIRLMDKPPTPVAADTAVAADAATRADADRGRAEKRMTRNQGK